MTWGKQNTEAEAHEQLNHAFDFGLNFMDTAGEGGWLWLHIWLALPSCLDTLAQLQTAAGGSDHLVAHFRDSEHLGWRPLD